MNGHSDLSPRDRFLKFWPQVKKDIIDSAQVENLPADALDWFEKNLEYNTPGGKLNRGTSVVDTLQILKGRELDQKEYHSAAVLGWCVELSGVGNIAINDSFMLEASIYVLLKKHFRNHPAYVNLLELFHDTTYQTELGQLIDLLTAPEDSVDLSKFSLQKHHLIVVYKTSFYSFYLPVALAMRLHGITSPSDPGSTDSTSLDLYKQAMDILLPLGEYFQVQDDYLDCYGDPEVIGKVGTDIIDNKCSWNINVTLTHCTPEQRKTLDAHYGRKEKTSEDKIKEIFDSEEVNLKQRYADYEEESFSKLNGLIGQIDESLGLKKDIFRAFLAKIYRRTK
ncbi:farnesyl diphosphate synthase [Puccinia sorghi]|uniref:(2E,6E)-farnesyl diphosphate synthase n=1 Tax=Puccinia sorghi TaxID=27349 RepID=A0A0L6VUU7_9BASI|nr:farnesyl diphosphate synthase [Puccinia sorghi]